MLVVLNGHVLLPNTMVAIMKDQPVDRIFSPEKPEQRQHTREIGSAFPGADRGVPREPMAVRIKVEEKDTSHVDYPLHEHMDGIGPLKEKETHPECDQIK